ncbi:MAG: 2-hydroxyacid dehydrogenase [Actinomycetota bacterium]|nr:2-hydroxyacid dehydrogenase [Actinomycetota bacterium]
MKATGTAIVVVTFGASGEIKDAIVDVLGTAASVVFLADLAPGERREALETADAVLAWNLDAELEPEELEQLAGVGLIQFVSAGVDHIPFDRLPAEVPVASNAGAYAGPMAEHVLAMALALAKRLPQLHAKLARGEFDQRTLTKSVRGSVVGTLGFGGIGHACAALFEACGARIHAINRSGRTDRPVEFAGTLDDLDRVPAAADVLVISVPLTRSTRGLIGRRELELMKPDAILVNVARGAIVDEAALYEHLRGHPQFSAGIDAWWDEPHHGEPFRTAFPFFDLPNVLGSPHNSALTPGSLVEANRYAAENVLRHLRGEPIRGLVRRDDYAV